MTPTATKRVHVIRLLPTGNSPAARIERAHLQASNWLVPGVPGGTAVAGRAYLVDVDTAAGLLRKEWVLCDPTGKPTGAELPAGDPDRPAAIRPGTEAWYALPLEQRPGTEEYRQAEFDRRLDEAYAKEQEALTTAHGEGAHKDAPVDDCPVCAVEAATAAEQLRAGEEQPQQGADGAQTATDGPQGASTVNDGTEAGAPPQGAAEAPGGATTADDAQSARRRSR